MNSVFQTSLKKLKQASKFYTPAEQQLRVSLLELQKKKKWKSNVEPRSFPDVTIDELKLWVSVGTTPEKYSHLKQEDLITILLFKLEEADEKQKKEWKDFVRKNSDPKEIQKEIAFLEEAPVDTPENKIRYHILKTLEIIIEQKALLKAGKLENYQKIPNDLVRRGVVGLLSDERRRVKIHYLSDTIKDGDTTSIRIAEHYRILEEMFNVGIKVTAQGSAPGRSVQTGAQILQLIGQSAEISLEKHCLNKAPRLFFMVNNADRSKHRNKEKAQGSPCLWARVKDPRSNVVHDVIGVDWEVFSVLKEHIVDFFIVEGIPGNAAYADLSKGTQFRSLHNFPYPQLLNALSGGGAPAGFRLIAIDKEEYLNSIDLAANEIMMVDPDHYLNGKSLSAHRDGILGLCKALGAKLDEDRLIAKFYHPDTGAEIEKFSGMEFIPTEYLGKHTGENCVWNGSSRGLDGQIFVELGKSKGSADDAAEFIRELPIGTRVKFEKKISLKI